MSLAKHSIFIFGLLCVLTGLTCFIFPYKTMKFLDLEYNTKIIPLFNAAAISSFNMGIYYMLAAYNNVEIFYKWTIIPRLITCIMFIYMSLNKFNLLTIIGIGEGIGSLLTLIGTSSMCKNRNPDYDRYTWFNTRF